MDIINLISYLTSVGFQERLLPLKIVFIVFFLFFLGAAIYLLLRTRYLKFLFLENLFEFLTYRPYGVRKLAKIWAKIMARVETGTESEYKLAVIEADRLLDDTLKRMGYTGEGLGDRLKQLTKATLSNLDLLGEVHKIRNDIVHDPDYKLTLEQTKKTLETFEQALRDLQAL